MSRTVAGFHLMPPSWFRYGSWTRTVPRSLVPAGLPSSSIQLTVSSSTRVGPPGTSAKASSTFWAGATRPGSARVCTLVTQIRSLPGAQTMAVARWSGTIAPDGASSVPRAAPATAGVRASTRARVEAATASSTPVTPRAANQMPWAADSEGSTR